MRIYPLSTLSREQIYAKLAIYESAIVVHTSELGVSPEIISQAMHWRIRQAIISQSRSGFAGEVLEKALAAGALPEFQRADKDDPVYWIVLLTKPVDGTEGFAAVLPARRDDLATQMAKFDETEAEAIRLIINVSSIVCDVEQRLDTPHTDRED